MTSPDGTKRSAVSRVAGFLIAAVAAIGGYVGAQLLFAETEEEKTARLNRIASEMAARENPTEPRDMGDGLKLLSVRAEGKDIIYSYSVPPEKEVEIRYGGAVRDDQLKVSLCASPAREMVDAGINFVYVYLKAGTEEEWSRSSIWLCT